MKKITIPKEVLYIIALLLLSLGVAISVSANLGISTCSAPGLVISLKMQRVIDKNVVGPFLYTVLTSLTFGEWIVMLIMLITLCIVIRKFKPIYFTSFITAALYGIFLLAWQQIPCFNPNLGIVYPYYLRVILIIIAVAVIALSVAIFFKNYFYPNVYNFQEKAYMEHFNWKNVALVKVIFDTSYGLIAFALIGILFQDIKIWNYGLNWGTILSMVFTGPLISLFSLFINKSIETKTLFPKLEKAFEIESKNKY